MIVFDLQCGAGHVFEAWFASTSDFEGQQARGLVACPLCGASDVAKAAMAPAVGAKGNRAVAARPVALSGGAQQAAEVKAMLAKLAKAQAEMLAKSENVGAGFADEARAIHLGDAPERAIHGQASLDEARSLIDDGVPVAPLPLPIAPPESLH